MKTALPRFQLQVKFILTAALLLGCEAVALAASFDGEVRPLIVKYCVACHGGAKVNGDVDLAAIMKEADLDSKHELFATVSKVLAGGDAARRQAAAYPSRTETDSRLV